MAEKEKHIDKDCIYNLDHTPTLDELKELFHNGNDFSAMSVMDIDYDKLSPDTVEALEYIKSLMHEPWNEAAKERGFGDEGNYGEDNPLLKLQGSMEDLVSGAVYKLMTEHPENVAAILSEFDFDDPKIHRKADEMLRTAVGMTMDTMDYAKLVRVMKELPAEEDFSKRRSNAKTDFFRKWFHSRTGTEMVSLEELTEGSEDDEEGDSKLQFPSDEDAEAEAIEQLRAREFWATLNDKDKELLELKVSGMTTQEIANELGYKTHSAVVKRLQKLKEKYDSM